MCLRQVGSRLSISNVPFRPQVHIWQIRQAKNQAVKNAVAQTHKCKILSLGCAVKTFNIVDPAPLICMLASQRNTCGTPTHFSLKPNTFKKVFLLSHSPTSKGEWWTVSYWPVSLQTFEYGTARNTRVTNHFDYGHIPVKWMCSLAQPSLTCTRNSKFKL